MDVVGKLFFEARFEDVFYSISDPTDPQKTCEPDVFLRFCIFSKIAPDIDFGPIFAPFSDPTSDESRSPEVSERDPKKDQNTVAFGRLKGRFCMDLGIQLGSWGGPRRPFLTFFALLELSLGEDGPRMPQEPFQDRIGTDFCQFLVDFQWIFDALAAVSSCVKARAGH